MSTALILNANNAALVARFLENAPSCISEHILEFNPNHREAMKNVFSNLFSLVFCPLYFRAQESDIFMQQENHLLLCDEIQGVFECHRCEEKKKAKTVLKHLNYGFNIPNPRICDDRRVAFCDVCYYYIDKHEDDYFDSDSEFGDDRNDESDEDSEMRIREEIYYDIDEGNFDL